MRKSPAEGYADEQSARIDRLGLTEDVFDAADQRAQAVANQNLPARAHALTRFDDTPGPLPIVKVVEFAEVDGFVDAALGRPMSIAYRFTEARLHEDNMKAYSVYAEHYMAAYRRKTEQMK